MRSFIYELFVPPEVNRGLWALPPPSPGDIFLDFEGDAFAFDQGLEYLFGVLTLGTDNDAAPTYASSWELNRADEKIAFERFIAAVCQRRRDYPDMHIYHYGAYVETAIKRMTGRHATCANEVDEMLRAEVFVDLYRVVKQALRASVESYSLKKLEPLYKFDREVPLVDANLARNTLQAVLAFGPADEDFAVNTVVQRESLLQLGAWVADNGIDAQNPFKAARELVSPTTNNSDLKGGANMPQPIFTSYLGLQSSSSFRNVMLIRMSLLLYRR